MPGEAIWFLLVGGLLCTLGALGGILSERRRLTFVMREQAARNSELRNRCTEMEELVERAQVENKAMSSFLVVLPDVVRQLNSHMSQRNIPALLLSTIDQIFEPAFILIYMTRGKDELVLSNAKGVMGSLARNQTIRFGQGRVGLVARHQTTMDRDDLQSDSLFLKFTHDHQDIPGVPIDLIAPMVHEGSTQGVICVGRVGKRQRDEKRMIKLVADLGSLALTNSKLFARMENTANADSLTNLSTKRYLNLRLGGLIHDAEQNHTPLSVLIFDIDHFKKFNDTFGHLAGDAILKTVASLMKNQLRADDIAARYGGEEFVVVLPSTAKEDAARIAEKIRKAIETHKFTVAGEPPRKAAVTVSGGVAAHVTDGASSNEILGAADQALYLAKERGRNQIVQFRSRYLSDDEAEVGAGA